MEIIGVNHAQFRDFATTQQRHEAEVSQFRHIFDTVMERGNGPDLAGTVMDREAIRNAAEMFESFFINMMFREMRRTTESMNPNSLIPRSHADRIFTEMKDEQLAEEAARAGGIGIADMIYNQMTRHLPRD